MKSCTTNTLNAFASAGLTAQRKARSTANKRSRSLQHSSTGKEVTVQTHGKDKYKRTIGDVILPDGTNVNHTLVKEGWCWWYRKYAPGDMILEGLEKAAREAKKGLWADPRPVPPWEWRKRKLREWAGLCLGVGALGLSLRRSQRDHDFRAKIKFLPLILPRLLAGSHGNYRPAYTCEAHRSRQFHCHSRRLILSGTPARASASIPIPAQKNLVCNDRTVIALSSDLSSEVVHRLV